MSILNSFEDDYMVDNTKKAGQVTTIALLSLAFSMPVYHSETSDERS